MKNGKIDLNSQEMLDLVAAAKHGDKKALSRVVILLTPVVRAQAKRIFLSNGLEDDDLFQEGMFGVFSAVKNYDPSRGASFLTYANLCIRSKLLSATGDQSDDSSVSFDEEIGTVTDNKDRYSYLELHDFIRDRLTQREFITLKLFLSGYSYALIAEKLGTTVKAVDGTLQRVRKKLREYFD